MKQNPGKLSPFRTLLKTVMGSPIAQIVKNLPAVQEMWIWSLEQEDPQEKGMATHSSILI